MLWCNKYLFYHLLHTDNQFTGSSSSAKCLNQITFKFPPPNFQPIRREWCHFRVQIVNENKNQREYWTKCWIYQVSFKLQCWTQFSIEGKRIVIDNTKGIDNWSIRNVHFQGRFCHCIESMSSLVIALQWVKFCLGQSH